MIRPTLIVLCALAAGLLAAGPPLPGRSAPAPAPVGKGKGADGVPVLEASFTDGSVMKLKILDDKMTLKTPYGKLVIPLADVHEVEFATRIPEEAARQVAAAVSDLGSSEFKKREAASEKLSKLHRLAYSALLKAEADKDPEVQKRARKLLEWVRKEVSEDLLKVVEHDVVHTQNSKISGRIEEVTFKGETAQFGEVKVKLSDVVVLRSLAYKKEEKAGPGLPDPGTLTAYEGQVGKTFTFRVTGMVIGGPVWGTDFYTLDSALAVAAVHAGVVQPGKAGSVTVKMHGPRVGFVGSVRNGVMSAHFPQYPGAYEIVKK